MVGLTFLDLGAENGAPSAPPAAQDFFRGARQFSPGPPISPPSMLCGSNFLQRFLKYGDTPQSGQKAIFRKTIITAHRKISRNEVVLMMLSHIFLNNVTPSIFALLHSKMTKTPNFHASYLHLYPHDRPLVLDIASSCCPASTYIKSSMSEWLHRVHSCLVGTKI